MAFRNLLAAAVVVVCVATTSATAEDASPSAYKGWNRGPSADPSYFPIAVWLQDPGRAAQYKQAGVNLYVGLWRGPNEEQIKALKAAGMPVICSRNAYGRAHEDEPIIVGWMHGDEPDNAQSRRDGKGYDPPVLPEKVAADYQRIKAADPTRPVLLNLGQGVAWDQWIGRGTRRNHPEDYPEYVKGCDIASFDIYPACHDHADVAGKLWLVADGVTRLRKWAGERPVWNCIECTHISNPKAKATPQQVKAEIWMSLVRGSRGIIYFVHQFEPQFIEAGLLADDAMLAQVTALNKQIQALAPVINSPDVPDGVIATSSVAAAPVEAIAKRHGGATYVFAVAMRDAQSEATFQVAGLTGSTTAEVLGEDRQLKVENGQFRDTFRPWDVHLYRILAR
jgi:hypothetical protein